tara:strand:- start:256 stop:429 length:174 start_codon:yes stop_codon:yes gene_type:complete
MKRLQSEPKPVFDREKFVDQAEKFGQIILDMILGTVYCLLIILGMGLTLLFLYGIGV